MLWEEGRKTGLEASNSTTFFLCRFIEDTRKEREKAVIRNDRV